MQHSYKDVKLCVSSKISLRILVVYQKIDLIFIAVATVSVKQGNCL